jgi:DNA-binding GntR family transcriptional regulator
MALARVAPPELLTDRVFDTIHAAIMSGELPAGTQLKIRDLAEQVGTSVMPVREAIRRLEESGLAVREPHKGAVVKNLTMDELLQTYQVRILLEVEAARLGGAAVSDADCARMQQLCDQLERAVDDGDILAALNCDEALLTVLYVAGGNPVLLESIRGLWQRCRAYTIRGAQRASDLSDRSLWTFQARIVRAARSRDGDSAAAITRESMLSALDRIGATFAAEASASPPPVVGSVLSATGSADR